MYLTLRVTAFLLLGLGPIAYCQQSLEAPRRLGSFPVPEDVQGRLNSHLQVACSADGGFLVPLTVDLEKANSPLVRFTPNGAVLGRIDIEAGTGLGNSGVLGFAITPDGRSYVLAREVFSEDIDRDATGRVFGVGREWKNPGWLLKFDAQGNFIAKQPLSFGRKMFGAALAVLPSGVVFVTTSTPLRTRAAPDKPWQTQFVTGAFLLTKDGLRTELEWPVTEQGGRYHLDRIDTPILSGKELWVVRLGVVDTNSFLYVFDDAGKTKRTVKLEIPADVGPMMPRAWGNRLLVKVESMSHSVPNRGSRFLELDPNTGKVLADYTFPSRGMQPICPSSAGSIFFGISREFEVFQPLNE